MADFDDMHVCYVSLGFIFCAGHGKVLMKRKFTTTCRLAK